MQYIRCTKKGRDLSFFHKNCAESRGLGQQKLVLDAIKRHNVENDFDIIVNTDDVSFTVPDEPNIYSYSTLDGQFNKTIPDFNYEAWPECGVPSYRDLISRLGDIGSNQAQLNKIGWIGALHSPQHPRRIFKAVADANPDIAEAHSMEWRYEGEKTIPSVFLSYEQLVEKYNYLIDIEGAGYSGRLKTLLCSNRIVFIADRPYKEWFYPFLKPWVNHVPVKRDMSDLVTNFNLINNDKNLQQSILQGQRDLKELCLTYDSAIQKIADILKSYSK